MRIGICQIFFNSPFFTGQLVDGCLKYRPTRSGGGNFTQLNFEVALGFIATIGGQF